MQKVFYTQKAKDNSEIARSIRLSFDVLSILPYLWLASFALFVIATWLEVGHLPDYGNPDPKDTALAWLFLPTNYFLLLISIASLPVWSMMALSGILKRLPLNVTIQRILLYLLPIAVFFVLRFQTGLFDWLMD